MYYLHNTWLIHGTKSGNVSFLEFGCRASSIHRSSRVSLREVLVPQPTVGPRSRKLFAFQVGFESVFRIVSYCHEMFCNHEDERHVIVVVGRTGVGVSSLVNLLAGFPASGNSPDARRHTRRVQKHAISIRLRHFSVYEIPGFGGDIKEETLINYVRSLHTHRGVDLVLYCMRPIRGSLMPQTFRLLRRYLHEVPFVAVVTGLEHAGVMEKWWSTPSEEGKSTNENMLRGLGMTFQDHVCITTLPEAEIAKNKALLMRRDMSEQEVRDLVCRYCWEDSKVQGTGGVCRRLTAGLGMRAACCAY
ncbi:hypothetical protein EDD15DRAFT_429149 [Pisolithus albus]|nr:hypothetical protein EDD15DRAFT_429149 [Pisolithus albus]